MSACHDTMITGSSTLELDTDSDTTMKKLDKSVSLTRMGEEVFFVRTFPCSRYGAKPCARLVCSCCDWRRGNIVCWLCDGSNVVVIDLHAHEEHGGANLGWQYGLCLPHCQY